MPRIVSAIMKWLGFTSARQTIEIEEPSTLGQERLRTWFGFDADAGLREDTPTLTLRPIEIEERDLQVAYRVGSGDIFSLDYSEHNRVTGVTTTIRLLTHEITEPMVINRAVIFRFRDALGFSHAFGAMAGTKESAERR